MTQTDFLPIDRLTYLENFGHSMGSTSYLYQPTHKDQVAELFALARERDLTITFRGGGRSYGDAALNAGGIVIDIRRMNRVLAWNPETGIIEIEPGVTIQQLWQYIIGDGYWPPVVPGTMFPTIGGCLGMNIHGKNNWKAGTIGEHVLEFDALLPNGEEVTCTPENELFFAIIGGLGMLGMITRVKMKMKKLHSGNVRVRAWAEPDLLSCLQATDEGKDSNDYIVGWLDCTEGGAGLGRGQMHSADYLHEGEDPAPAKTFRVEYHTLPPNLFGIVPKSIIHVGMRFFMNNPGVRLTNTAKYTLNRTIGQNSVDLQSLGGFNFLLDYVPDWERAYGRGGLIQYQCFIPKETAHDAFREIISLGLRHNLPNYLGVLKRHRPDQFLLSHAVDGYSFAQDYRVTDANRHALRVLTHKMDDVVLEAGGRFYFAKDSTMNAETVRAFLGNETVNTFRAWKKQCDPDGILESDLYRRCFLG
jgi:FAD/FMN-containing dehydrogenase